MASIVRAVVVFVVAGSLLAPALAEQIKGRVIGIADGDTITVLDASNQQHKIRLAGIDAPEKAQAFGQRSKENLSAMVFGRQVTPDCGKVDRYSRDVCKILVAGVDANFAQIKAGMAWWYWKYAKEQASKDRENYEIAELGAKSQGVGLWDAPNPVPPWEWRRSRKELGMQNRKSAALH